MPAPRIDAHTESAVRQFLALAARAFPVRGAILYGSRARHTHRPDSDADVAVLMDGAPGRALPITLAMSDMAFEVLLETGLNVAPMPIWTEQWAHPETHPNPALLRNIARDGIRL